MIDGVILVSGIPGSGKTTVSRRLAAIFERAAHLEGDRISFDFIVSGLVPPQGPPVEEGLRQLELRRRNTCLLADSFADAGFVPIIDDVVVSEAVLEFYRTHLRTRPLRLVQLTPPLSVVEARDAGRDKHVFHLWSHLHEHLHQRMPRVGLWLDNSALTVDETVEQIVAKLADAEIL